MSKNTPKLSAVSIKTEEKEMQSLDLIKRDCNAALNDLVNDSYFQPLNDNNGPYKLTLSIEGNKLVFHTKNRHESDLPLLILSLSPYRKLVRDYFLMVHAHHEAVKEGMPSRIEAIDMGRRGLHNEGAELLIERLGDKIDMDMKTARHLFTLICVLHQKKIQVLR